MSGAVDELFDGDGFDFFVCRVALQDFLNAVLDERRHPFCQGGFQHLFGACLLLDHSLHGVRTQEEFVQGDPAFETGSVARFASLSTRQPECIVLFDAELIPIFSPISRSEFFILLFASDVLFLAILAESLLLLISSSFALQVGRTGLSAQS